MLKMKFANIQREYEKNEKLKKSDVEQLQIWLDKQPHLPQLTELQVILFMQSCYFSIEKAKITIDNFYTIKTHCPEIFSTKSTEALQKCCQIMLTTMLSTKTPENYSISFTKFMDYDLNKFVLSNVMKLCVMVIMHTFTLEGTTEGFVSVFDAQGLTFGILGKMKPTLLKQMFFFIQNAIPLRIKGIHFINVVPVVDKILTTIKPFIKSEFLNMIYLHESIESFYKYVPKECLPQDYGGEADTVQNLHRQMKENIFENTEFFINEDLQLVDESKRPGKPLINAEDLFGMPGSFRQLEID